MATVYASEAVQVAAAQQALDEHITMTATGLCRTCDVPGPCAWWEAATAAFAHTGRLPQRTHGLTRPDLVGRPTSRGGPTWWAAASVMEPDQ